MNKQVQSIPAEIARSEPAPTLAERLRIAPGRFCRLPWRAQEFHRQL